MPDLTRNLAASRRIIIIHIMKRFFTYLIISLSPMFMSARENVTAQDLVGRTFVYDNWVKKCSIEFLDSTTCVVTQQFTIPDFPKEYKYLQTTCNYRVKKKKSKGSDEGTIVLITKVLSPLPDYINGGKQIKLPLECKKKLNTFIRYPNDNSKDFFPNGVFREGVVRDYASPRTFWEVDGFLLNPRKLHFLVLFSGNINGDNLDKNDIELSNAGVIWDCAKARCQEVSYQKLLPLVGKKYSNGSYIKEELSFINDSICIYTQECECLPEEKRCMATECTYSYIDGLLILNNKHTQAVNCLPIYQDSTIMSACIKEYTFGYKNTHYSIPGYVVTAPTLFNIIRSDTLTVTPNGSLLYYKMLMPEGLDPMFIAREYKEDIIIKESEDRDANIVDYRQRRIINY